MQFTMKLITVWNGHTQLMFAFSDLGRPRVLSLSKRLVYTCTCISLFISQFKESLNYAIIGGEASATAKLEGFVDVENVKNVLQLAGMEVSVSMCWLVTFNSLRPSDAIWRHRSGSTLAQVMACCLTAPSHYLNQCWQQFHKRYLSHHSLKLAWKLPA